jgi:hypothetical protein
VITLGITVLFAFWPLGLTFIAAGVLLWLSGSQRVPWKLVYEPGTSGKPRMIGTKTPLVDERIVLADLPPIVRARTFKRCEIISSSPALLVNCQIYASPSLDVFDHLFVVTDDVTHPPDGTTYFIDCCFLHCQSQS